MSEDGIFGRIKRAFAMPDPREPPIPAPPALPPVEIDYEDTRIPSGAKTRIQAILARLREVEAALAREHSPGFTRIDLDQLRNQHLPKLVKSYIDISPAQRSEIFRKTGTSASFVLNASLDHMQQKIDEILRNLAQQDIDAFLNNARFIGERYTNQNPFD